MRTTGIELVQRTAIRSFWNGFGMYDDPLDGLIYSRPSTQKTDTYTRLGAPHFPNEWKGDRDYQSQPEYSYSLTNKAYEASIRINKELVKFEQWDEIMRVAREAGMKARAHRTKLHTADLDAGESTTGDDGQFFFDTDHADPGARYTTSQDNDLTANITDPDVPTDTEMRDAIQACFNALRGFKDDQGDPFSAFGDDNAENFVLLAPTNIAEKCYQLQTVDTLDTGSGTVGNPVRNRFRTKVNRFMATSTTNVVFYFCYRGSEHKPLVEQIVSEVDQDTRIDPSTGDMLIELDWWGRTGYGQWRTAVRYEFT